jgi:hypothetical protein
MNSTFNEEHAERRKKEQRAFNILGGIAIAAGAMIGVAFIWGLWLYPNPLILGGVGLALLFACGVIASAIL